MKSFWRNIPWAFLLLVFLVAFPFIPGLEKKISDTLGLQIGTQLPTLLIYGILGLALNVVLGYTGQLHLGIAAFFGIGAITAGVFRVELYPFQFGFWQTILVATAVSALIGVLLSSPTLRLRGDYLALVTLGFGMITTTMIRKFEEITGGKRLLGPINPPVLPHWLQSILTNLGIGTSWTEDYRLFYFLCLGFLMVIYLLLANLERSRLGRAWYAIREDELAASCMGINTARMKLASFALGAAIAGMAGALYAIRSNTSGDPNNYEFPGSATILCAVILGGLGNRNGVLLGIFFIEGFELIFSPIADKHIQSWLGSDNTTPNRFLQFSTWKMMIFGLALILVMRFRPHGLLSAVRGESKRTQPSGVR